MNVLLSDRLQWIANRIPKDIPMADVGTDHALLPIYLIQSQRVPFAVATDISEGPCQAARENVARYGLVKQVSIRKGDGLSTVQPGEVGTVTIAGMGGATVAHILDDAKDVLHGVNTLLIQPMNASRIVRKFLFENGFGLVEEGMIRDAADRTYECMMASRDVPVGAVYQTFSDDHAGFAMEFGPLLLQQRTVPAVRFHFREQYQHLKRLSESLLAAGSESALAREAEIRHDLEFLQQWLQTSEGAL